MGWGILYTSRNSEFTITQQSVLCNSDFCVPSAHFGVQKKKKKKRWIGPVRHRRYPLDSRWTTTVEDATQMMRKAVWFCPMSGLRYAAIVSKISADLCLSIALRRCHYLCGFALLYPHRSRPQLFLSSLSSPSPPSLYVTLLKSDRCGVNLQPSLTPSLLRTSRSHCLRWGSWQCSNYTVSEWVDFLKKKILGRKFLE